VFEFIRRLLGNRLKSVPEPELEAYLQRLLTTLQQSELRPTAAELADTLWFALQISSATQPGKSTRSDTDRSTPDQPDQDDASADPARQPGQDKRQQQQTASSSASSPSAKLYPGQSGGMGGTRSAQAIRSPAVPALPDALALGRALRPMHRKIPDYKRWLLDEEQTIDRIAGQLLTRQKNWQPVLKHAQQRWMDLALVIDIGNSMLVWQPLLKDLRRLFNYNGAFRTVRSWYMATNSGDASLFAEPDETTSRRCRPEDLLAYDGRRLIIIVSDGVSPAWHTGSVNKLLQSWGQYSPVVMLQMLPQRMWTGTVLGRGDETRLFASAAGVPNTRLIANSFSLFDWDQDLTQDKSQPDPVMLKLPVIALEHADLLAWANVLAGKQQAWVMGTLFGKQTEYMKSESLLSAVEPDAVAVQKRLQWFYKSCVWYSRRCCGNPVRPNLQKYSSAA
jgi:hypothetical protein